MHRESPKMSRLWGKEPQSGSPNKHNPPTRRAAQGAKAAVSAAARKRIDAAKARAQSMYQRGQCIVCDKPANGSHKQCLRAWAEVN